ncbi:MAG: YraN family protein [Patescibacteria group bacterium]
MTRQTIGSQGEDRAAQYLQSIGYRILERNKRYKLGEIDIVAKDGDVLVLVEVKAGKTGIYGYAIERVGTQKRRKLRQLAARFSQDYPRQQLRIDLVNVNSQGEVIHILNAVEAW